MAKRIDEATREAIRKDAAAGLSIEEIRKKHHVSWPTANGIAKGSKPAKNGKRVALNGAAGLKATPAMCDALWSVLPLEKKAGLLNSVYGER